MTDETWDASVRAGADASLWSFPGADASLWSLPGADPPRSPLPDADAPRSPLPGADAPRSPLWGERVFITNVKGTFLGMSESEEASKRR